ncbi:MAG: hypothetical protein WC859_04745 [Elusimicrobiota bacterium]
MPTLRLPSNKTEEAELRTLAQKGPYEVYKWIYGPDHFFTQSVGGKSWESLHVPDAATGACEILDSVKQLKRNRLDGSEFVRICFMTFAILLFIGELIVTKFLPNTSVTLSVSTLTFTFGISIVLFSVCASATYLFLRLRRD